MYVIMLGKGVFRFRSNQRLTIRLRLRQEKERRWKLLQQISHAFFFASRLFFHLCLDSRTVPTHVAASSDARTAATTVAYDNSGFRVCVFQRSRHDSLSSRVIIWTLLLSLCQEIFLHDMHIVVCNLRMGGSSSTEAKDDAKPWWTNASSSRSPGVSCI